MRILKPGFLTALFLIVSSFSVAQNQNISNGVVFDGEPYLVVDPADAQHMVIAWMGYVPYNYIAIKTRVTFDGGDTWSNIRPVPHVNPVYGSADVSLAFNGQGRVFLSFIDFKTEIDSGAVYVVASDDGGLHWGDPVEVINAHSDPGKYPVDRPWMSVDRSGGVNDGNIYVTTMPPKIFGPLQPPFHPYFTSSTNGGETFNQWRYLDTINWLSGDYIQQPTPTNCVSTDGVFYAVYPSYVYSQNILGQFILASTSDAGQSFTYHTVTTIEEPISDTLVKRGYLIRSDPSDAEHLIFVYLDIPYGDIDVFMRESFNGGVHWSDAVRVNDDTPGNNKMQDLPWAGFNADGDLVVTWRDRRNAPGSGYTTSSEIWGAARLKNSNTFSENFRISDMLVPYDTILSIAGNDFMCVQLADDTINVAWGDPRNGKLNIWFQRLSLDGVFSSIHQIASEQLPVVNIFPNPFNEEITIEGKSIKAVFVYNQSGQLVFSRLWQDKSDKRIINPVHLAEGIYFIHISTANGMAVRKILKR